MKKTWPLSQGIENRKQKNELIISVIQSKYNDRRGPNLKRNHGNFYRNDRQLLVLSEPSLYAQGPSIMNAWHLVPTKLNVYFNRFVNIDGNYFKLISPITF